MKKALILLVISLLLNSCAMTAKAGVGVSTCLIGNCEEMNNGYNNFY